LLKTLEDGIHTADIYSESFTKQRVGTKAFTQAVIDRLGQRPAQLPAVLYKEERKMNLTASLPPATPVEKRLVGVDVFLDWNKSLRDPNTLGHAMESLAGPEFQLKMITNRGVKVYPDGFPETFCTDHWRCRFVAANSNIAPDQGGLSHVEPVDHKDILGLLNRIQTQGFDFIKTENLYEINGKRAYSLGQGE
jgi:isocitrate dehydrogenase